MHVSGEQLTLYTGIAAILRFPLTMPDEVEATDSAVATTTTITTTTTTTTGVTAATAGADLSKSLQGLNIKKV